MATAAFATCTLPSAAVADDAAYLLAGEQRRLVVPMRPYRSHSSPHRGRLRTLGRMSLCPSSSRTRCHRSSRAASRYPTAQAPVFPCPSLQLQGKATFDQVFFSSAPSSLALESLVFAKRSAQSHAFCMMLSAIRGASMLDLRQDLAMSLSVAPQTVIDDAL